jgi:hypothetical protein
VLANAAHVKNVPGRKSDVSDATWVTELLAHGLIRASFVPNAQTQEMRNLLRTRKQLVREQSSHVLRVQKTLEDANIKLDSALTDVMGKSGRAMIEALIAGETNPAKLASLADRRVKASAEKLRMLKDGTMYQDLSCDHFERHSTDQQRKRSSSVWQSSATRGTQAACRLSRTCGTARVVVARSYHHRNAHVTGVASFP